MDRLQAIFNKQKALMEKYHHIEVANGLVQTEDCPVDINSGPGQARIKDFAWRFIEELGEALYALGEDDYKEELMDGLHFLVEMSILTGKDYDVITIFPREENTDHLENLYNIGRTVAIDLQSENSIIIHIVKYIAMTCNCLKNKPWKQTYVETDTYSFYVRLERLWISYFALLYEAGFTAEEIYQGYLNKASINQKRQEENY